MADYQKTKINTVRRGSKKAKYNKDTVHSILDAVEICHIAFIVDGKPFVQPINFGRKDGFLYLHGSPKNRMTNALIESGKATLSVTIIDAMKLTKSAFNHSVNYRSAVVFGKVRELHTNEEKLEGLKAIINHFVPERWEHCRRPDKDELLATRVLEIEIETASAKIADTPLEDKERDLELDYWSGIIPVETNYRDPISTKNSNSPPEHVLDFCKKN